MTKSGELTQEQHTNNFDFLRLLAAFMVLYSHQRDLLGLSNPGIDPRLAPGSLGVCIFFAISGFLVTQSWLRDPHFIRFVVKRFLRIWPALAVVTVLAAFVLGPVVSTLPMREYFADPRLLAYLRNLRLHMVFNLPGVFETNPFPGAVNGSTWSIPVEVRWYVILAAAGLLTLLKRPRLLLVAVVALAVWHFAVYHAETNPDRNYARDYGLYFCVGALMVVWRGKWRADMLVPAALAIGCGVFAMGQHMLGTLIALAPSIIGFGNASTPILRRFGRCGDLSYGVYLYAFMIQQVLIWRFGARMTFAGHLAWASALSLAFAWLSWHLIEKPSLGLKQIYRSGAAKVVTMIRSKSGPRYREALRDQ